MIVARRGPVIAEGGVVLVVSNRRGFFAGVAASAVFAGDAVACLARAGEVASGRQAEDLAGSEDYWAEIRRAFDADRTLINLNHGGVAPAPSSVLESMIRDVRFANVAPSYHMWDVLEPRVESVRRELAREFGCDPEEMAITRNASEGMQTLISGIDLKPGDEVLIHEPELRPDDDRLGPASPPRRDRRPEDLAPPGPGSTTADRRGVPGGDDRPDQGGRGHARRQPDRR